MADRRSRPGAKRGSPEWRSRVREGTARGRARTPERAKVGPRDLRRLERDGVVSDSARPLLAVASDEAAGLHHDMGGRDHMTAMQSLLVGDAVAVGVVLRGGSPAFCRSTSPAPRIGTLASARRSIIRLLELERATAKLDLQSYATERADGSAAAPQKAQNRAGPTRADDSDPKGPCGRGSSRSGRTASPAARGTILLGTERTESTGR